MAESFRLPLAANSLLACFPQQHGNGPSYGAVSPAGDGRPAIPAEPPTEDLKIDTHTTKQGLIDVLIGWFDDAVLRSI